jgi:hypothetical protein
MPSVPTCNEATYLMAWYSTRCVSGCFDTDHAVLQATVDNDLPELERAVQALAETLSADEQQEEGPPNPPTSQPG